MKYPVIHIRFCVLVLLTTIQSASAISCYVCNSHVDSGCDKSPVDSKYLMECGELKDGAKYDRCRKIKQWVDYKEEDMKPDERIIRSCGWNQTDERSCYYRAGFGGRQQVCTCYEPSCNDASQMSASSVLGLTLAIVCLWKVVL